MRKDYMMKRSKYAYCEKCDNDVEFKVIEETRRGNLKGVSFNYIFKKAVCKRCGEQVFPVSIGKENYIAFTDGYKSAVGLLTSKEIIQIRKELKLSQTAMAKKISCGEKNIARYEMGAIQLQSIDQAIRNLVKPSSKVVVMNFKNNNQYSEDFVVSEVYVSKKRNHNPIPTFKESIYKDSKRTLCNA